MFARHLLGILVTVLDALAAVRADAVESLLDVPFRCVEVVFFQRQLRAGDGVHHEDVAFVLVDIPCRVFFGVATRPIADGDVLEGVALDILPPLDAGEEQVAHVAVAGFGVERGPLVPLDSHAEVGAVFFAVLFEAGLDFLEPRIELADLLAVRSPGDVETGDAEGVRLDEDDFAPVRALNDAHLMVAVEAKRVHRSVKRFDQQVGLFRVFVACHSAISVSVSMLRKRGSISYPLP